MSVTILCSCGNSLEVQEALARQRLNCPVCGGSLTVPAPDLDDAAAPIIEEPEAAPEDIGLALPRKKKKKKLRATDITPLSKREKRDLELEREEERKALFLRIVRGFAYLIMGLLITAGAVYALIFHYQELLERLVWGAVVAGILLIGLAAIGKGLFGLVFGQFVGD